jgi:glycosyltransferase involved in cell wall biosynthesis
MIGEGPDKPMLLEAAKTRAWLHVHGALYGLDRDTVLARCNAILMPGLVGLIAIDSFQFERPVITSDAGEHSPEIAYLRDGQNCLVDHGAVDAQSYADLVSRYLSDVQLQKNLRDGCRRSAELYSIDNMAANFCHAITRGPSPG